MGRVSPMFRKGLQRFREWWRLSLDVARDPTNARVGPSAAPFMTETLGRLPVSRGLGYRGVGFALSVAIQNVRLVTAARFFMHHLINKITAYRFPRLFTGASLLTFLLLAR